MRRLSIRGATAEHASVAGQAVFEIGVLLFELLFQRHPIGQICVMKALYVLRVLFTPTTECTHPAACVGLI